MPSVTKTQCPAAQSTSLRRSSSHTHTHTHVHTQPFYSPVVSSLAPPPQAAKGGIGWAVKAACCLGSKQLLVQKARNLVSPSLLLRPSLHPQVLGSGFFFFFLPWVQFPADRSWSSGSAISQHHLLPILASTSVPFQFLESPGPDSLSCCVHPVPVFGKEELKRQCIDFALLSSLFLKTPKRLQSEETPVDI